MSEEYPLFPTLTEAGQKEAQDLIEDFKKKMKGVAEEVIGNLYCDVIQYIESDSWTNFRNELISGLRGYPNRRIQGEYDFKKIRQAIYKEYKKEIDKDLDQDNLARIKELEEDVERLNSWLRDRQ